MRILGIESSCDETAASVVENGNQILSSIVATSSEMHVRTGGIIPENAAREQVKSIIPVVAKALRIGCNWTVKGNSPPIDAVAITIGPGLIGSLLVGVETAKTLSYLWKKPIIPVNHLIGHIYANWLSKDKSNKDVPEFPSLALVVSGGHTDLVFMKDHGNIKWIGGTRDDAAGEAFDKTARLLGLEYPGGPSIQKEADSFFEKNKKLNGEKLDLFPRPLINEDNYDWSFSGLKTAVLRELKNKDLSEEYVSKMAAEVQEAIVDVLVVKSLKAVNEFKPKSFLLAGGVAANKSLRDKFSTHFKNEYKKTSFHVPGIFLCTDNAAYISSASYYNYHTVDWKNIEADPQLTISDES